MTTTNLTLEEAAKADSAKQYPLIGKPKSEYGDQVNQEQGIAQRVYARGFKAGAAWRAQRDKELIGNQLIEDLISLAEDGYKLHLSNGCHQEFLKEDREILSKAKAALLKQSGGKP